MWKEFGLVIGIAEEVLDGYSSYPPEECLVEVLDYWLRKHHTAENKLTWRDVVKVVKEIGLHQLAENILNVYQTGMTIPLHGPSSHARLPCPEHLALPFIIIIVPDHEQVLGLYVSPISWDWSHT